MFQPRIVIQLDGARLRQVLDQLRVEINQSPEAYSQERIRHEQARRALEAIFVRRTWFGPPVCEDCQYFHGHFGINCALHPSGPPGENCPDWKGPPRSGEGSYCYVEGRGWTLQKQFPGQGWTILREGITPEEISATLTLDEFYL